MEEELMFRGRVWCFEDNVDTDQILPGYAMSYPREKLKEQVMRGSLRPDFASQVRPGDIIVAGDNFGCGSSREQAPIALKDSGIAVVIARSFGRIFRRNAINIGLPVLQANLADRVQDSDIIAVDIHHGRITLPNATEAYGAIPGASVIATLVAGGLINKVRRQFANRSGTA